MIEVNVRNRSLFDYFDANGTFTNDDNGMKEITNYINDRKFIADFATFDWEIWILKQEIHDNINPYQFFTQSVITPTGIREIRFIDFYGDVDYELYFKIKYMSA